MNSQNFFFIDARVQNYQAFVAGIQANDSWALLNADQDGLDQMVNALSGVKDLASIQIISHGAPASLTLGSTTLNLEALQNYQVQLAALGASLSVQGDIQLYGCDVAQGDMGEQFVQKIAELTQADVSASKDLTGASSAGGNWTLEYAVGQIDTSVLVPAGYSSTLDTITGDSYGNNLIGTSGDDTINGLGGADTIDGQAGSDSLSGGDGDDKLEGNFGNDSLYGGNGIDTLTDDQGSNVMDGGNGNDNLTSRSLSGDHTLLGGAGNDSLNATGQKVSLDGGDQDDNLNVTGQLQQGGSTSYVIDGQATLLGGMGNDNLNVGNYASSSLDGGDGNDNVYVSGVWDNYTKIGTQPASTTLVGGAGDDMLNANMLAAASLNGGDGVDSLSVNSVTTATLMGGAGTDTLNVNAGDEGFTYATNGSPGKASKSYTLDGGDDDDTINVVGRFSKNYGQVTVSALGGAGNDTITVNDNVAGDTGTDGQGFGIAKATLSGGEGDDTLTVGGVLGSTLTGGTGADKFVLTAQQYRTIVEGSRSFANSNGTNSTVKADPVTITDFAVGAGGDVLDYSDLLRNGTLTYDGSNPFGSGFLKLEQSGADTLLSFDADGATGGEEGYVVLAVLKNVSAASLAASNFNPNYPPNGGAAAGQLLNGSSLAEPLMGGFGNDTINGLGGADTIDGQAGSDSLSGGDGDDKLEGNFGNDSLYGGNGNDTLTDDQGSNVMDGGNGNDNLTSRSLSGDHTLLGGAGNDSLNATGQKVSLDGGDQDDNLNVTGQLQQGGSTSYVIDGQATLLGGMGNDNLNVGNYASSSLDGGDGNDNVYVSGVWDNYTKIGTQPASTTLVGGAGDDMLNANMLAAASLNGGDGVDSLSVNSVTTATLMGGAGTDTLNVNAGDEGFTYATNGSPGKASKSYTLDGGDDDDTINVVGRFSKNYGQVTVSALGGAGNDTITVNDNIAGDTGTDGQGFGIAKATLSGGEGDDTLTVGGVLGSTLTGGTGADKFVLTAQQYRTIVEGSRSFANSNGTNSTVKADPVTITDFAVGAGGDVLDYSDLLRNGTLTYDGSNPFGSGFLKLEQSGADTLLSFDADGATGGNEGYVVLAVLKNVSAASLAAGNFNPNFALPVGNSNQAPLLATTTAISYTDSVGNDTFVNISGNLSATDADNDTLNYGVSGGTVANGVSTMQGSYGTLSVNTSTGAYTFAPNDAAIEGIKANTSETFAVTVSDGKATTNANLSVNLTGANDAPTGAVTISGTAKVGQTLTASNSLADAEGMGTVSYQWSASGVSIEGATASTLVLGAAQQGKAITVKASYTDGQQTAESVTSSATTAVAADVTANGVINLGVEQGANLNLLAPYTTKAGKTYYLLDTSGDGVVQISDELGHDVLDKIFNNGADTVDTQPTGAVAGVDDARTLVKSGYTLVLPTTTEFIALRTELANKFPEGWQPIDYDSPNFGTATRVGANVHHNVSFKGTTTYTNLYDGYYKGMIVLQVMGSNAAPVLTTPAAITYTDTASNDTFANKTGTLAATDADNDTLTYGVSGGTVANGVSSKQGSYGTLSVNTSTGSYTFATNDVAIEGIKTNTSETFAVTVSDGKATGNANLSVNLTGANDTPTGAVTISGTAKVGQTLTAGNSLADAEGMGSVSYQWYASDAAISGATASTLVLGAAQQGKTITVKASYTDGQQTAESMTSSATTAVAASNTAPGGSVTITGTTTQGQTLTASNTLEDAEGMVNSTVTYQWLVDGVSISGASGNKLTLTQAQVGKAISVTASYSDDANNAENKTSTATAAIANVNDAPTGDVSITGSAKEGMTLTAQANVSDVDGIPLTGTGAIRYQWQSDNANISGATAATYIVKTADVGRKLSVVALYTDNYGTAEQVKSAQTDAVVGLDNSTAGVSFSNVSDLRTTEAGDSASYGVVLKKAPRQDVVLTLTINDETEGVFASGKATQTLTFTSSNWNTAQTVTVKGVDDGATDGNITYSISTSIKSNDLNYDGMRSGMGLSVANVSVTNADDDMTDEVRGTEGNDTPLNGGNGPSDMYGLLGRDEMYGNKGDDRLYGGYGDDVLYGGDGNDELEGEQGNDKQYGEAGNDNLKGGTGADSLYGGDGDDTLNGGEDADYMDGGNGSDTYYLDNPGDVVEDTGTDKGRDTLFIASYISKPIILGRGIEDASLDEAARDSTLTGNETDNTLSGNSANNQLNGGAGSDELLGGGGSDSLSGGEGNDELYGGTGSDTLDGGAGEDCADYADTAIGVFVSLIDAVARNNEVDITAWTDKLISIENACGSAGNDQLLGDAGSNKLEGREGNDLINGGAGFDYLEYMDAGAGVVVNLSTGVAQDGQGGTDTLLNMEGVMGSAYADVMVGDAKLNVFWGYDGNDSIDGGAGTDEARYEGNSTDYSWAAQADGQFKVTDLRTGTPDGVDLLKSIEKLVFADKTVTIGTDTGGGNTGGGNTGGGTVPAPNAAALSGQVYEWKSHALLSGVGVKLTQQSSVAGTVTPLFELKGLALNAQGDASAELWVNFKEAAGSLDLMLQFDKAITGSFVENTGALPSGWSVIAGGDVGSLTLGGMGLTDASGSVKLGVLNFDLPEGVGAAQIKLVDGSTGSSALTPYAVSVGGTGLNAVTDAEGKYGFELLDAGSYKVEMGKALTTTETGSAINSADALAALKIAVGRNPNADPDGTGPQQAPVVSPYQFIAADANQDGKITSSDALAILKMAVKRSDAPAREWLFVNENQDFWNEVTSSFTTTRSKVEWDKELQVSSPLTTQQNVVAVLKGDVNGSWTPPSGSQDLDITSPAYFADLASKMGVPANQWAVIG